MSARCVLRDLHLLGWRQVRKDRGRSFAGNMAVIPEHADRKTDTVARYINRYSFLDLIEGRGFTLLFFRQLPDTNFSLTDAHEVPSSRPAQEDERFLNCKRRAAITSRSIRILP